MITNYTEYIVTLRDFWTIQKCTDFIQKSETIGYEPALIQTEKGARRVEGVRNNQRVLFSDENLANEIWNDLRQFIPFEYGNSRAIGLNELFRFYKYEPGQQFKRHRDQSFIRNEIEASYFTLMIYLNEEFEGGETTFNELIIKPKTGSCLIFLHDLEHEGAQLTSGTKYVLRTDIMYQLKDY